MYIFSFGLARLCSKLPQKNGGAGKVGRGRVECPQKVQENFCGGGNFCGGPHACLSLQPRELALFGFGEKVAFFL